MKIIKDTLNILTIKERKSFYILIVLMVVGAFLEMAGVGLIIPALALMSNTIPSDDNLFLSNTLNYFGNPSEFQLLLLGIGVFVGAYLVKMAYLILLSWYQTGFINKVRASVSRRLFSSYMNEDWTFHTHQNSAKSINILNNETSQFSASHLTALLNIISELMVIFLICGLLFFIEPQSTILLLFVLSVSVSGFYLAIRNRTKKWGFERQLAESKRIQSLQQGLGGAKEIKLLGRESEFTELYSIYNIKVANVVRLQAFTISLPRLFIEFLTILVFGLTVIILSWQDRDQIEIISVLGLFAAASLRLMPSINRIIASGQALRFSNAVLLILNKEFASIKEPSAESSDMFLFSKSISIKSVDYAYPDSSQSVIKDLSMDIPKGSSIGIVGESGSGKSTLMDMMMGLIHPTKGQILVDDIDISTNVRGWHKQIGYVPQTIYLSDDTLRRNIAFGLSDGDINDHQIHDALKKAQLSEFVNNLDKGLDTVFGERGVRLSGGQRQRIGIARALYHNPSVLFLDEASSALDLETEAEVMKAVNSMMGEKTIIIIAHRISTIENCDLVYDVKSGNIVKRRYD